MVATLNALLPCSNWVTDLLDARTWETANTERVTQYINSFHDAVGKPFVVQLREDNF